MSKKIILAYSGGLDTTYAIHYLAQTYESEVIALLIDIGEEKQLDVLERRAIQAGATHCHIIDGKEDLANDYLSIALQANGLYEGAYPLISALSRPLITRYLVDVAHKEKAFAVAHGCTAKGNDQIRFDLGIRALDPRITVIAPLREHPVNRTDAINYMETNSIDIPITKKNPYSIDMNIWGRSCECGILEDPWEEPPADAYMLTASLEDTPQEIEYIKISFEKGIPCALNGAPMKYVDIISALNRIAGTHGVGRIDHLENRVVGIKSREIYESPAGITLITAHKALETMCLTKGLFQYKASVDKKIAELIYDGMWYSQIFEALCVFLSHTQEYITGDVRMKLFKGNAIVVGMQSDYSLYDIDLSTYNPEDTFDHEAAAGFVKLYGLPLEIYAHKRKQ